jgi:hypothetical protein
MNDIIQNRVVMTAFPRKGVSASANRLRGMDLTGGGSTFWHLPYWHKRSALEATHYEDGASQVGTAAKDQRPCYGDGSIRAPRAPTILEQTADDFLCASML